MPSFADPALHPESGESRLCAFCSYRGKLTGEHVWPQRFRDLFPQLGRTRHQRGDLQSPIEFDAVAFTATVNIDCNTCNNQRLESIERDASPYVKAMALALTAQALPPDAQRRIAAFALRMFAVSQYTHPRTRPVPRRHREHLVMHQAPPDEVHAWIWGYNGRDVRAPQVRGSAQLIAAPGERLPKWANAYRGILRIGHLVIEMATRTDGIPFPFLTGVSEGALCIWPPEVGRVAVWPPGVLLDEDAWDELVSWLTKSVN
jgi:hypothetical protein